MFPSARIFPALLIAACLFANALVALPQSIQPVPGAAYYEVQWLRAPGQTDREGPTERFSQGFPRRPPSGFSHYRVRSVSSEGLAGPWSKSYAVDGDSARTDEDFELPPSHYVVGRTEYYSLKTSDALRLRITSSDSSSGLRDLWVKINERDYTRNEDGTIELRDDGRYSIYWYAVDNVGHKSATQARFIYLDSSGPELTTRVLDSGLTEENEVTSDAKLAILARDDGVGLAGLRWRSTVQETWQKYRGPIELRQHTTGNHGVIFIHSYDRLGNETPLKTFVFQIQVERPAEVPKTLGMLGKAEGDKPVEVPPEGLKIDGLKEGETLTFEMENGDTIPVQNGDTVQFPGGKNRVTMTYTDQLGRKVTKTLEIVTDRDPPETILKIERKQSK